MYSNNFLFDLILKLSQDSGDPMDLYGLFYGLQDFLIVISLVGFLISIVQCLFGFKLMKFWIAVQGFFIGGLIGLFLGALISHMPQASLVFALIGAIVGAISAYFLYKVGVFINSFFLVFFIVAAIMVLLGSAAVAIPLGLLFGIAAGVIAVIFIQPIFILTTSISGGMSAGSFMATILNMNSAVGILFGIILSGLGIFVQIKMNGGFFEHKKKPEYPQQNWNQGPSNYNQYYSNQPVNYNSNVNPNLNPNNYNSNVNPNLNPNSYNPNLNPNLNPNNYNPNINPNLNPNSYNSNVKTNLNPNNINHNINPNYYPNTNPNMSLNHYDTDPDPYGKPSTPVNTVQSYTAATSSSIPVVPNQEKQDKDNAVLCSSCGKDNAEGTKFCIYCGNQLNS